MLMDCINRELGTLIAKEMDLKGLSIDFLAEQLHKKWNVAFSTAQTHIREAGKGFIYGSRSMQSAKNPAKIERLFQILYAVGIPEDNEHVAALREQHRDYKYLRSEWISYAEIREIKSVNETYRKRLSRSINDLPHVNLGIEYARIEECNLVVRILEGDIVFDAESIESAFRDSLETCLRKAELDTPIGDFEISYEPPTLVITPPHYNANVFLKAYGMHVLSRELVEPK